jgi:phenylalanine-4-hydroxylase
MDQESSIPPHLRRFVVRQDYSQYNEEDQAVWRFVVQHSHARLLETAHPAYARGFDGTGISVERIPRIDEMSERLSRFGWRAVCVDGFIPPRAFQAFQALGILPIATDIRTSKHLTYTPAPDIIHEAAGHAPFLTEPHYADYVRRVGEVGQKAFAKPSDHAVYDAIYTLSEVKENPAATPAQLARAESALARSSREAGEPSEATKLARLYWWTAEYGLVGTLDDYRSYGAGLLSSIGEGHFSREPSVRKVPLDAGCVSVDYDITRAQPQLFVVRDLSLLDDVLSDVERTLAFREGGARALRLAVESEEVATLTLDSGVDVVGMVTRIHSADGVPFLLELSGHTALARDGAVLDAMPRPAAQAVPLGRLADGTPLSSLSKDALSSRTSPTGELALRLESGLEISGRTRALLVEGDRVLVVLAADLALARNGQVLFRSEAPFPLALGEAVRTACAGAPRGFHPPTAPSDVWVPKPRTFDAAERERIGLYERGVSAFRSLAGADAAHELARVAALADRVCPDDWLLRYNLLESLVRLGERGEVGARLETDLERLEIRYEHREPIATGLAHLRSLVGEPRREPDADPGRPG